MSFLSKGFKKLKKRAGGIISKGISLANTLNKLGILPPGAGLGIDAIKKIKEYEKKTGEKLKFDIDKVNEFRKQAKKELLNQILSGKINIDSLKEKYQKRGK
jgi:hypothetical protein